ncbi:hypothetical protein K470DRAFT_10063 [Piedraia hortae CBS 480.64]|uniref:INO80 complex subunit F domain-containing protein n=1 Tax=Piedraia hortae CBS 480.64 TaxID=1314780 RepID=A0A6A7C6V0_9PEZI|nr:hypothetical protein K470DRAFT_10063 [Piedraia hortae CBS 480.64]
MADSQTANTPLAPSVEKAYYRKCIHLKRRLNEVEDANNEAAVRIARLERGILKMRLERAFIIEQLGKTAADLPQKQQQQVQYGNLLKMAPLAAPPHVGSPSRAQNSAQQQMAGIVHSLGAQQQPAYAAPQGVYAQQPIVMPPQQAVYGQVVEEEARPQGGGFTAVNHR